MRLRRVADGCNGFERRFAIGDIGDSLFECRDGCGHRFVMMTPIEIARLTKRKPVGGSGGTPTLFEPGGLA